MTRKKRERRRLASDAFAETLSHQVTNCQYTSSMGHRKTPDGPEILKGPRS